MTFTCWDCGLETTEPPCDADGSGQTGMVYPPFCLGCAMNNIRPVRLEAFREKFPDIEVALMPSSTFGRCNQAYYVICRHRGIDPAGKKEKARG